VHLVRQAKKEGLAVTAEVAPHHFTLTDDAVRGYDTNTKMSPPLRSQRDIDMIKEGLSDGTIDIIATDHAPHDLVDKQVDYSCACFGIVGLETALPLSLRLVDEKILTLPQMVETLTHRPAEIFKLDKGTLGEGKDADITIFDPNAEYSVDTAQFKSKSKNSPFQDWKVKGRALYTIVKGKIVYSDSDVYYRNSIVPWVSSRSFLESALCCPHRGSGTCTRLSDRRTFDPPCDDAWGLWSRVHRRGSICGNCRY